MIDKEDKNQTPAPKVSSGKETSEKNEESNLKNHVDLAEDGAKSKTGATKTPQKIQDGETSEKKREY